MGRRFVKKIGKIAGSRNVILAVPLEQNSMTMKNACLLFLLASGFSGCVSTSLPSVVIPEYPGSFDAGLSFGLIGFQADVQYAVGSTLVAGGAYSLYTGPGPVNYGEARLGAVVRNRSRMLTAVFGHGKFNLNIGFPTGGLDNSVDRYYGHFHKASLAWNHQHPFKRGIFGIVLQAATWWGTGSGVCGDPSCYQEFHNRRFKLPLSVTPIFYLRVGQEQGMTISGGATLSLRSSTAGGFGDADFFLNPAVVAVGWVVPVR